MNSLTILKFAGILVSGALGIIGTLTETREKTTGRLLPWGRWAFALTVGGLVTALGAQMLESVSSVQKEKMEQLAARRQAFLQSRSLDFLKLVVDSSSALRINLTFDTQLQPAATNVASELSWLAGLPGTNVPRFDEIEGFSGVFPDGWARKGNDDVLLSVRVRSDSPFHPMNDVDGTLKEFLRRLSVWVQIEKPRGLASGRSLCSSEAFTPVPSDDCDTLLNSTAVPNPNDVILSTSAKHMSLSVRMPLPVEQIASHPELLSLEKLANTQLVLFATTLGKSGNKKLDEGVVELLKGTTISTSSLSILVAGYRIPLSKLPHRKSSSSEDGEGFHSFRLPDFETLKKIAVLDTGVISFNP